MVVTSNDCLILRITTCPLCHVRLMARHTGPLFLGIEDVVASSSTTNGTNNENASRNPILQQACTQNNNSLILQAADRTACRTVSLNERGSHGGSTPNPCQRGRTQSFDHTLGNILENNFLTHKLLMCTHWTQKFL